MVKCKTNVNIYTTKSVEIVYIRSLFEAFSLHKKQVNQKSH